MTSQAIELLTSRVEELERALAVFGGVAASEELHACTIGHVDIPDAETAEIRFGYLVIRKITMGHFRRARALSHNPDTGAQS